MGSSPLSRGIRHTAAVAPRSRRIIPALAGNTCSCEAFFVPFWDHPRSRGEYSVIDFISKITAGSSPLSRGIRNPVSLQTLLRGIIPALAGNTRPASASRASNWDHPRSRGEYGAELFGGGFHGGSSPLSRGIRHRPIPDVRSRRDHPRSRGEYKYPRNQLRSRYGSSPLSRGIRIPSR